MFHCGGCSAEDEEQEPVVSVLYQRSSYETTDEQSTLSSSYKKARKQQVSFDAINKFDIDARKPNRKSKTAKAHRLRLQRKKLLSPPMNTAIE